MILLKYLSVILGIIATTCLGLGVLRTRKMEYSQNQKIFASGSVPSPVPDGFYRGEVMGYTGSWQGKIFNAADASGINILKTSSTVEERFPFKTMLTKGLRDGALNVMMLDYNIPGNPLWLRRIRDEIVQIEPNHYKGKVYIRIIPGYPFTVGYFELTNKKPL